MIVAETTAARCQRPWLSAYSPLHSVAVCVHLLRLAPQYSSITRGVVYTSDPVPASVCLCVTRAVSALYGPVLSPCYSPVRSVNPCFSHSRLPWVQSGPSAGVARALYSLTARAAKRTVGIWFRSCVQSGPCFSNCGPWVQSGPWVWSGPVRVLVFPLTTGHITAPRHHAFRFSRRRGDARLRSHRVINWPHAC